MSTPTKSKSDDIMGLTPNEARILLTGILVSGEQAKIDYEQFAAKAGYKTAGSASVMYRNAKRRLMELHGDDANASTASPDGTTPVKKTPAKRKSSTPAKGKAAAAATDSGDDANAPPASSEATATPAKKTPTKRKASTPAKGKGAAAATATDSGDADSKPAAEPKQETGAGAVVGDGHGAGAEDAAASPPATGGGTVEENPKKRQRTKKGIARKVTKKTQETGSGDDVPAATPKPKGKAKSKKESAAAATKSEEDTAAAAGSDSMESASEFDLPTDASVEREIDAMDVTPDDR